MKRVFGNFKDAEDFLFNLPKVAKKNPQKDCISFYKKLGNPGAMRHVIHVAGTNGKGSVCAYIAGILKENGKDVGMFTSPHLVSIRERIQVNGKLMNEKEFLEAVNSLLGRITKEYTPTFFEFLFFMGMMVFESREVDYIILETGIGGRLDVTNIIEKPQLTILTKIGKDHTDYLGETIEEITKEKAGILKNGVPLVFLEDSDLIKSIIVEEANKKEINYQPIRSLSLKNIKIINKVIDFSIDSRYYGIISISLEGSAIYQVQNIALAIGAIEEINKSDAITKEVLKRGIDNTIWQGRMEEILPHVYLDGAHNIDGIKSFIETVKAFTEKDKKNSLLFSAVKSKDYREMIELLVDSNVFDSISVTQIEGERSVACQELKSIFEAYTSIPIKMWNTIEEAWNNCMEEESHDNLYVAGSLFLVGRIKQIRENKGEK